MTHAERELYRQLTTDYDSYEDAFESFFDADSADAPLIAPRQKTAGSVIQRGREKPVFSAQFDLTVLLYYFDVTVATGVHANIAAAALPATLKTRLTAILFGNSDWASGYSYTKGRMPVSGGWEYYRIYTYGLNDPDALASATLPFGQSSVVTAYLSPGDLVIEFTYTSGGATDNKGIVILRSQTVAYATLLTSLGSDRFVINNMRYTIPDTTKVAQYSNSIKIIRQTLFGSAKDDSISPQALKKPEQYQAGIVDIPIKKGIDKESAMALYVNYDCIQIDLSIFVWKTKKLVA